MKRRFFLQSAAALPGLAAQTAKTTPLKVACVGGHPDDPESGCGGTLARYSEAGHCVNIGVVVLKTISGARIFSSLVRTSRTPRVETSLDTANTSVCATSYTNTLSKPLWRGHSCMPRRDSSWRVRCEKCGLKVSGDRPIYLLK